MTDSMYKQIDMVAAWAANATEQAFRHYVLPPAKTVEDKNTEKMNYALEQARAHLPPEVNEKFTEAQLAGVIEAKVAENKARVPTGLTLPPPPV